MLISQVCLAVVLFVPHAAASPPTPVNGPLEGVTVQVSLDLRDDRGQNIGTLFTLRDERGRAVAGAGVVSVNNANVCGDRMQLNAYLRPPEEIPALDLQRLPRPNADAGACLFTRDGGLYTFSYGSRNRDLLFRRWDPAGDGWRVDESVVGANVIVRGLALQGYGNSVLLDGRRIFFRGIEHGGFGFYYYAAGRLFMNQYAIPGGSLPRLIACRWTPGHAADVDPEAGDVMDLSSKDEFAYCYGQLGADVIVGTSRGALHAHDGARWRTIVPASEGASSQFYCMINYDDQLLLGHYPSGCLWSWDGRELRRLADWPPRPPGARSSEREAQTAFLHAGELYVGVWPWGELWRLNRDDTTWHLVGRMFTHPEVADDIDAPYARESEGAGNAYNRWGQRVMGMATLGDSLYVSTSAKTAEPYEERLEFLGDGRWREYGSVLRLKLGHNLAVPLTWTDQPMRIDVQFRSDGLRVLQDGAELGSLPIDAAVMSELRMEDVVWGAGVYGRCGFPMSGTIVREESSE